VKQATTARWRSKDRAIGGSTVHQREPGDPDNVLNENHVVILEMDGSITVHASIENRVYRSDQIGGHGRSLPRRGPGMGT